jgi:hypothetical protein
MSMQNEVGDGCDAIGFFQILVRSFRGVGVVTTAEAIIIALCPRRAKSPGTTSVNKSERRNDAVQV